MTRYQEALELILSNAHSFGKERIALDDAYGRVLSEKILADRDYPPFNRSAMDGFAMKFFDLENGIREFRPIETIYAGHENANLIDVGECYKIMTGAAVPRDADIVVRKEDVGEHGEIIRIQSDQFRPFQNIAKKGEDMHAGKLIIDTNMLCNAPLISLLAAIGKTELVVERLPKVTIITTGNEIKSPNSKISSVQIRNSNAALLKTLLKKQLGVAVDTNHVNDDPHELQEAFLKAMDADIIISSGGVSAGAGDYVPAVLRQLGIEELIYKVAIKPGKPFWCGRKPNKGMVFALPGNPFSSLVTYTVFVQPFLRACFGLPANQASQFWLDGERSKKGEADEFFPVRFNGNSNQLEATHINGSGDIQAALFADGIALHPFRKSKISNEFVTYFSL